MHLNGRRGAGQVRADNHGGQFKVQGHFITRDEQEPRRTCQATKATLLCKPKTMMAIMACDTIVGENLQIMLANAAMKSTRQQQTMRP